MASTRLSNFEEFDLHSGDWNSYIDRFSFFMEANGVTNSDQQRALFYSVCGRELYELIISLIIPKKTHDVPLKDVVELLCYHFSPRPNEIVESYKFHCRSQQKGENMADYIAELRKLSRYCNFIDLERTLRDRLVCGVRDKKLQDNLLQKVNLTYATAVETVLEFEKRVESLSLIRCSNIICETPHSMEDTPEPMEVNIVHEKKKCCFRCGGSHMYHLCRFKKAKCHRCMKVGHIAKMCSQNNTDVKEIQDFETRDHLNGLFAIGGDTFMKVPPINIDLHINKVPVSFEVDSGSAYTIISEVHATQIWNGSMPALKKCKLNLQTWTFDRVKVLGSTQVLVEYKGIKKYLRLLIAKGRGQSLLGRNWFKALGISIEGINLLKDESLTMMQKYEDVFNEELGVYKGPKVTITLKNGAQPQFFRCRPIPFAIRDRVGDEIDRLVNKGILEPVPYANWATPIVPVIKKNGCIRLCGDYRLTVNSATETDTYPQPTINEAISVLAGGQIFSKLDLKEAYTQVTVCEETAKLLTITTHKGLYKVNRLPYGLKACPGIFQRLMSTTLAGVEGVSVLLDDILVAGANKEQHDDRLEEVLKRLQRVGLTLNKVKCKIATEKVEFLGYVIDQRGIHPSDVKVKAIHNASPPKNVKELQAFLGLLNFYERFIPNKATTLEPLHRLLDKDVVWKWGKAENEAFIKARGDISSEQTLIHFDKNKQMTLTCDASDYGAGAVLAHIMEDGTERPIMMGSRTFNKHERNYAQIDKEAAAIMFGLEKFNQYVYGRHVIIYTDHKPLLGIFSPNKAIPKVLSPRMMRWALKLNSYDYELKYKQGSSIGNADALSRWPIEDTDSNANECDNVWLLSELPSAIQYSTQDIAKYTAKNEDMAKIKYWILHGWPDRVEDEKYKIFWLKRRELSLCSDCIMWGNRVVIPPPMREFMLQALHETHDGIVISKSIARSYFWWPGLDQDIEVMVNTCESCQVNRNMPAVTTHSWVTPTNVWQRLHIDFAGPYHGKYFFIAIDAHSKWPDVKLVSTTSSKCAMTALRNIFAEQGLPEVIVSDNGRAFTSDEFKQFMKNNAIRHVFTPPYTPSCNGQAERTVQTVKSKLQKMSTGDLDIMLPRLLFALRTTPNTVTGKTPAEVLNRRRFRNRFDILHPFSSKSSIENQIESNKEVPVRLFQTNDRVWVRNYSSREKWVKGVIKKIRGPVRFLVEIINGPIVTRHINQLRRREVPDDQQMPSRNEIEETLGIPQHARVTMGDIILQ